MSLVGLVGDQGDRRRHSWTSCDRGRRLGGGHLEPVLTQLSQAPGAGLAFVLGLATALWSASGYVNAFSRATNRIYEIDEGRPIWKLRPAMLLLTVVIVVRRRQRWQCCWSSAGPVARGVGEAVGLGATALAVWNVVKWPVMLLVVVVIVAVLYYVTPNVRQPKFRWISVGAVVAIVVWLLRLGSLRVLRRQLLQLRPHLRLARRRHRLPAVAVDHEPRAAVRRRAGRRARARSTAAGRHRRRRDRPAAPARTPARSRRPRSGDRRTSTAAGACGRATETATSKALVTGGDPASARQPPSSGQSLVRAA